MIVMTNTQKAEVKRCESYAEFRKLLDENDFKVVKAIPRAATIFYETDGKTLGVPAKKWVLTTYYTRKTEAEDKIYRYVISFSIVDQYPDVRDKDDFPNSKELIRELRQLEREGFIVRGGEYGWPLQEKPSEYELLLSEESARHPRK